MTQQFDQSSRRDRLRIMSSVCEGVTEGPLPSPEAHLVINSFVADFIDMLRTSLGSSNIKVTITDIKVKPKNGHT